MIKSALLVLGFQVSQGIFLDCCCSASGKVIVLYIRTNERKWCFYEMCFVQLSEVSLYPCGLALVEQSLITLETHGAFESEVGLRL